MKAKIAFFRGIVAPLAPPKGRVTHVTHSCQAEQRLAAPTFERPRPNLKIIWRTNPANRRLECHWAVEGDAAADEGVSCGRVFRRAA